MLWLAIETKVTPGEGFIGLFVFLVVLGAIYLFLMGGLEALKKYLQFKQRLDQDNKIFNDEDYK